MTRTALRTRFRTLAVISTAVALTALGSLRAQSMPATQPAPPVAIEIDNFKFGVVTLDVPAGTTVTWTNRDDVPHTVVSSTKLFKSKPLDTGEAFSYTFKDAGTFEYYCSMHPRMTGKIVVRQAQ